MNERVWVKHGWTTIMCALVLLHICLGQKDCTGVDCPHLDSCIEEVLEDGACCATCSQRGCTCKGYQYYDCISAGFKKGKVPEGESYLVDSGSTECWCPAGGGNISCRFIPCPDVPPNCIELSDSTDACSHCLRLGCVHHNHKYEAGHSFHMDPCQVCHCPNDGGELMCSVIPDCSSEMAKNPEVKKNELHVSKHEHPDDFLSKEHTFPSNSVPNYTENTSEFEEEEDYDYFPEATTSPYTFVSSSATLQTQNTHEVLHEDTREELRETLGTYDVESREEETEDTLNSPITETDSRSYQKLSQTETIARHPQVPPRKNTTITTDDIRRTERNPNPYRNLHHTIPELNTLPKLRFISTTKPQVNVREREAHRQPQILGRYHQERKGLHLTSNNQRGE
ncbi:fibulin-2-like [Tachysurus ichikawai]